MPGVLGAPHPLVERMLTVSATCQQHERSLFPYLLRPLSRIGRISLSQNYYLPGESERIL